MLAPVAIIVSDPTALVDLNICNGPQYSREISAYLPPREASAMLMQSIYPRQNELKRRAHFRSDPFPMYIRLSYEPETQRQQKAPEARASNETQATEKIKEASIQDQP
ncbi:MAG: hypothetical protein ACREQ2_15585 [Candidatus Binatia bacterium]